MDNPEYFVLIKANTISLFQKFRLVKAAVFFSQIQLCSQ